MARRGPVPGGSSYLYVVLLSGGEGGAAGEPTGRGRVRVGRMSDVRDTRTILRRCRYRGARKLLREHTRRYEGDGVRSRHEVGLALERELAGRLRREGWTVANPPPAADCHVYVIEVDPAVRTHRAVRRANPGADPSKACLYVGRTSRTPEERFREHHEGGGRKRGGRHLRGRCLRLREDIYAVFNPMPALESYVMERELAEDLRAAGHTVLGGH